MAEKCYFDIAILGVTWLPFFLIGAWYVKSATQFVADLKQESPDEWTRITGRGPRISLGLQRAGPIFWLIMFGARNRPEYSRILLRARKPRLIALLCLLMFAIGLLASAQISDACFRL